MSRKTSKTKALCCCLVFALIGWGIWVMLGGYNACDGGFFFAAAYYGLAFLLKFRRDTKLAAQPEQLTATNDEPRELRPTNRFYIPDTDN